MKKEFKQSKGITLIALVITITVILILSGIAITSLTGENGLLERASKTREATTMGAEKDKIGVAYHDYKVKKYTDSNASFEVQGASVNGNDENGWNVTFNDTKNRYKLSADGTINEAKPTITMAYRSEEDYEGRPKYDAEKIEYKSIKVDNNTLECEVYTGNSDETDKVTSDIQKYDGMIDMINAGFLIYSEEFVPGFFVDSNWKIVTDFNNLADDDYYLFVIFDEDEINDLMAGNYMIEHGRWITGWFDQPSLEIDEMIGKDGIGWNYGLIWLDNNEIIDSLDDRFDTTLESFNKLIRSGEIVCSEKGEAFWPCVSQYESYNDKNGHYYGRLDKVLSLDSNPLVGEGMDLGLREGFLYDARQPVSESGLRSPNMIRLKSTGEYVDDFQSGFTFDENSGSWQHTPPLDEYEYYYEDKWYAIEKGHAISL